MSLQVENVVVRMMKLVCCPDGQECLTSNIVTSRVDPVEKCLGDAFEYGELADVPSEQICGIGDDPELLFGR